MTNIVFVNDKKGHFIEILYAFVNACVKNQTFLYNFPTFIHCLSVNPNVDSIEQNG